MLLTQLVIGYAPKPLLTIQIQLARHILSGAWMLHDISSASKEFVLLVPGKLPI